MKFLTRLRIFCKDNHGASLVELVLVTNFFLWPLVFGAIDLGHGYYVYLEVVNAAHAGAEYGSQHRPIDTAGMITAATKKDEANVKFNAPTPAYGIECSDGSLYTANSTAALSCAAGATEVYLFQVNTSAVYTTIIPWRGNPSSYTLRGSATIRGNYP
jgi:Flp pilus assembly protein TadG